MLDGAALGTLMIGLDSVRTSSDLSEPSSRSTRRRSDRPAKAPRHRLATALRFFADRLDGRATGSSAPPSHAAA